MKRLQSKLDSIYHEYTEEKGFEYALLKYKAKEVLKVFRPPRVLDIGCGVGILTNRIAQHAQEVIGIDGSKEKIKKAQINESKPDNVKYVLTLFEDYEPKELFDSIIMTNVLEHIKDPVTFLKKTASWLNDKGVIIATVPNALALHKQLGKEMGLIDDYYKLTDSDLAKGHTKNYDMNLLKKDYKEAGLNRVSVNGFFLKPLSSNQMEQYDADIYDGLYKLGRKYPQLCSSLIAVGEK